MGSTHCRATERWVVPIKIDGMAAVGRNTATDETIGGVCRNRRGRAGETKRLRAGRGVWGVCPIEATDRIGRKRRVGGEGEWASGCWSGEGQGRGD